MTDGKLLKFVKAKKDYIVIDLLNEAIKNFPEILPLHKFEPDEDGTTSQSLVIAGEHANSHVVNDYYVDARKLKEWYETYLKDYKFKT